MLVALTGGIGAGKSTVARLLAARGVVIVDADVIAREIVDPGDPSTGPVLAELRALLGEGAFTANGALDRHAVASIVFDDEATLATYNAILRSALITATSAAIESALARASGAPVVHEIPLLNSRSSPLPWVYDAVVTVEAPMEERPSPSDHRPRLQSRSSPSPHHCAGQRGIASRIGRCRFAERRPARSTRSSRRRALDILGGREALRPVTGDGRRLRDRSEPRLDSPSRRQPTRQRQPWKPQNALPKESEIWNDVPRRQSAATLMQRLEHERLGAGQEAHAEQRARRSVITNRKSRDTIDSMLSK